MTIELCDQNYINGEWVDGTGQIPVTNPSTGEVFGHAAKGTAEDVNRAINAAETAFDTWGQLSGSERAEYLDKMADAIESRKQHLIEITKLNNGKPEFEAQADVENSIEYFRYYAQSARDLDQRQNAPVAYAPGRGDFKSVTRFEPMGVVALILPWNFPFQICAWKMAPALAAGNTLVIKPASITPFVEMEYGHIANEAGLPAGVINIINGPGGEIGSVLSNHEKVRKVSFTGSNPVGARIMKAAAEDATNVALELGGKSPVIVFEDADLELAADLVTGGIFYNCGQCCNAYSRALVHENIVEELTALLKQRAEAIVIGPPDKDGVTMGPQTSKDQLDTVMEYVEAAEEEGLSCVTGGSLIDDFPGGYFIQPTIYKDVPGSSRLWNEEIFGPVLCLQTFSTEEEAISAGNDTDYGLAATIITEDLEKADRVAKRLQAGHVFTNAFTHVSPEGSWGGFKKSGIGRELGPWGLSGFLEVKTVTTAA